MNTFGSLYEGLRNRQPILTWTSIQMIRRLVLATTIGTLYNFPGLQLLICLVTSLAILVFYAKSQPFSDILTTRIEFLNEYVIILNYSFLCTFTEVYGTGGLEQPPNEFLQARQNIGLFLISTLGLIILVNMLVALKDILLQLCGVAKQVIQMIKEKFCIQKIEKEPIGTILIKEDVFVSSEGLSGPPPLPVEDLPSVKLSSRESEYLEVKCVKIDQTLDLPEIKESESDYITYEDDIGQRTPRRFESP